MAPSKNELIDNAQRYVQKGQFDKAIKEYEQVLKLDASDLQTRLRLGDVYAKKGAAREAIEEYLRVADRHANDGFYLKAIAVHKQILKLDPNFIESSARLADLYRKQGLLSDALHAYQQVATVYDRRGDARAALDTLTKMADLDSNNVAIRLKLGEMYLKANIRESGIEQLLKAAELLGTAGKQAEQVKVLDKILVAAPASGSANRAVLAMLVDAGQAEAALKRLNALVVKSPDDPGLRDLQVAALMKVGRTAEALEALEALVAAAPDRLASRRCLVELHLEAGDAAAAVAAVAGFAPEELPEAKLAEAVEVVRELAAREPPPAAGVRVALLRALVALCAARKDEPGREAAEAALAGALEEAGDFAGATVDLGGSVDPGSFGAFAGAPEGHGGSGAFAGATEGHGGSEFQSSFGASLTAAPDLAIEVDERDQASLNIPVDGAPPLDAPPTVDSGGLDLALDAPPAPLAAKAAPAFAAADDDPLGLSLDLDAPAAARRGPASPHVARASEAASAIDVTIDLPLGGEAALGGAAAAGRVDAPPVDVALDAPPRRSPEKDVLATRDAELSLDQIPEELDEAEFFVQQGLLEAARAIYRRILAVDPEHRQALKAMEALERGGGGSRAGEAPRAGRNTPRAAPRFPAPGDHGPSLTADGDPFDLAAVLAGPLGGQAGAVLAGAEEQVSFQEVFREFKQGVERQVGGDPEVHYNLGIAYKEMGLIDDAIGEFERALADPARRFDCYTMIGLCQMQRGDPESAVLAFQAGLEDGRLGRGQAAALNYELGLAYEAAGRVDEARAAFARVAEWNPAYRNVATKLGGASGGFDPQSLLADEAGHAADPAAPGGAARPRPAARRRDKISFV